LVLTMDPWDWNELVAGYVNIPIITCGMETDAMSRSLPLQPSTDAQGQYNSRLLSEAFNKYGLVPRNVYEAYRRGGSIQHYDLDTVEAIRWVTRSFNDLESLIDSSLSHMPLGPPGFSDKVVCLRRGEGPSIAIDPVSRFVTQQLLGAPAFATSTKQLQVCGLFSRVLSVE
jgi:hypothetical protein